MNHKLVVRLSLTWGFGHITFRKKDLEDPVPGIADALARALFLDHCHLIVAYLFLEPSFRLALAGHWLSAVTIEVTVFLERGVASATVESGW